MRWSYYKKDQIYNSIVVVGTAPYYEDMFEISFEKIYKVFKHCIDIRRSGSAAIDLCNLASGRVGLYFEQSLCPWDYAAGFLLVKEAAAYVHDIGIKPSEKLLKECCFDEQTSENKDGLHNTTIQKAMDNIFKTKTGISICKAMFGV